MQSHVDTHTHMWTHTHAHALRLPGHTHTCGHTHALGLPGHTHTCGHTHARTWTSWTAGMRLIKSRIANSMWSQSSGSRENSNGCVEPQCVCVRYKASVCVRYKATLAAVLGPRLSVRLGSLSARSSVFYKSFQARVRPEGVTGEKNVQGYKSCMRRGAERQRNREGMRQREKNTKQVKGPSGWLRGSKA